MPTSTTTIYEEFTTRGREVNCNIIVDRGLMTGEVRMLDSVRDRRIDMSKENEEANRKLMKLIELNKHATTLISRTNFLLGSGEEFASSIMDEVVSYIKNPRLRIYAMAATSVAKEAVSQSVEWIEDKMKSVNADLIGMAMSDYLGNNDEQLNAYLALEPNSPERLDVLLTSSERFKTAISSLNDMDDPSRDAVRDQLIERLGNMTHDNALKMRNSYEDNRERIDASVSELGAEVEKGAKALHDCKKEVSSRFDEFASSLTSLERDLNKLSTDIDDLTEENKETRGKINDLSLILYTGASPEEKRKFILAGLVEVDDQTKTLASLDKEIATNKSIKDVSDAVASGEHLVTILNDVGLKKEASQVNSVVSVASAAFTAYMSLTTPGVANKMAGIAAITGLLGGGAQSGPDPVMMQHLEKIQETLDVINEKISEVLDNQEKMLDQLSRIEKYVRENNYLIRGMYLRLNNTILDAAFQGPFSAWLTRINRCRKFGMDARQGLYLSYEQIRNSEFRSLNAIHWNVLEELVAHNSLDNAYINSYLLIPIPLAGNADTQSAEDFKNLATAYKTLIGVINKIPSISETQKKKILMSCSFASERYNAIDLKYQKLDNLKSDQFDLSVGYLRAMNDGLLLNSERIENLCEILLNVHYVRAVYDNIDLMDEVEILQNGVSMAGANWLAGALELCRLSIAQLSLMQGDILLPIIYETLEGDLSLLDTDDSNTFAWAVKQAVESDFLRVFKQNLVSYFCYRRLQERGAFHETSNLEYKYAYEDTRFGLVAMHTLLGTNNTIGSFSGPVWNLKENMENGVANGVISVQLFEGEQGNVDLPEYTRMSSNSFHQLDPAANIKSLKVCEALLVSHIESYNADAAFEDDVDMYRSIVLV